MMFIQLLSMLFPTSTNITSIIMVIYTQMKLKNKYYQRTVRFQAFKLRSDFLLHSPLFEIHTQIVLNRNDLDELSAPQKKEIK